MMRLATLALIAFTATCGDGFAQAQRATVEVAVTGGGSTHEVGVAAAQVSIFGEPRPDWRFFVEGAWGSRSEETSDAFGAAYPYDKRVRLIEAYGERLFRGDRFFGAVRAGRYRTPFGISGRADHSYSGFLRAPLIRYDGYYALSNNFLEAGIDVVAGTPHLQVEASLGVPQDTGTADRPTSLDRVVRAQAFRGNLIVGASYIHHLPYDRRSFIRGDASFVGLDARWMLGGIQVRGEWLTGRPHDNSSTDGWYVDVLVHRPQLGPVTLVFRGEDLDYPAGRFSFHAEEIVKAGYSAGSLTRQLLAFSRKQILAPRIVSLSDIVAGMTKMLQRLIGEDVELVVRSEHRLGCIKADPGQLEQVIMNLSVNARDAMPDGGRVSIELANHNAEGRRHVRLIVTDTGCGMDAETLSHIFDPFFTTKAEGQGTGLGLAMVYGIVEQSGGTIAVESQPGHGTSFCITFPRSAEELSEIDSPIAEPRPAAAASETLLLVEDDAHVRAFASRVLRQEGYRLLEAAQADEALAMLATLTEPIDLLLTDVVMPNMNGRALWEQASAARPGLRVLFMSGYTSDAVVRKGIHELNLPFLQKPFSVSALTAAVRAVLASDAHLPVSARR